MAWPGTLAVVHSYLAHKTGTEIFFVVGPKSCFHSFHKPRGLTYTCFLPYSIQQGDSFRFANIPLCHSPFRVFHLKLGKQLM